jgi:hypothetical protein
MSDPFVRFAYWLDSPMSIPVTRDPDASANRCRAAREGAEALRSAANAILAAVPDHYTGNEAAERLTILAASLVRWANTYDPAAEE